MKILIAEDEKMLLKIMELRLKKDGHHVITVTDGRDALKQLDANAFDIVITDIMMPFISGLEITGIVKKNKKNLPVIVLSAMGQESVVVEAFKLGADDFISKPLSPNELSMRIRRFETALRS
jgi:DNA-binding response OmpR family regulator